MALAFSLVVDLAAGAMALLFGLEHALRMLKGDVEFIEEAGLTEQPITDTLWPQCKTGVDRNFRYAKVNFDLAEVSLHI